jgi:hypothetical protein
MKLIRLPEVCLRISGDYTFYIPFVFARDHPRLATLLLYRLSPPEVIHGCIVVALQLHRSDYFDAARFFLASVPSSLYLGFIRSLFRM